VRYVRGFLRFWLEFVVGDDWRIAAGVVAVLAAGAVLVGTDAVGHALVALLVGAGVMAVAVTRVVVGGVAAVRRARPDA